MSASSRISLAAVAVTASAIVLCGCGHGARGANASPAARAQATRDIADGLAKQQRHDYKGAVTAFDSALTSDPNSAVALYDRGAMEYRLANYKAVVSDFKQAIAKADAGSPLAKDTRFYALLYGGIAREYLGDYAGTIRDESAALSMRPASATALINRGYAQAQIGHYHDAVIDDVNAIAKGARGARQ